MISTIKTTIFALTVGGLASLVACDADVPPTAGPELVERALEVALPTPPGLAAPVATDGTYYYIRAKHSNKCLHQHGHSYGNGDKITQWACVDQYNVHWRFDPSPDPDYYYISVRHSGKCVHQHGHSYKNGDKITQWDCVNQGNVKVRIVPAGEDYYYLQFQHSNKCIHVHEAAANNGASITQWSCINQPNVQWYFQPVGH